MAKQLYNMQLTVELQDMDKARRTTVRTKFKDCHGREWCKESSVPAPPTITAANEAVGRALREFADRGIGLADFKTFKSAHKAEETEPYHAEEGQNDTQQPLPALGGAPKSADVQSKTDGTKGDEPPKLPPQQKASTDKADEKAQEKAAKK